MAISFGVSTKTIDVTYVGGDVSGDSFGNPWTFDDIYDYFQANPIGLQTCPAGVDDWCESAADWIAVNGTAPVTDGDSHTGAVSIRTDKTAVTDTSIELVKTVDQNMGWSNTLSVWIKVSNATIELSEVKISQRWSNQVYSVSAIFAAGVWTRVEVPISSSDCRKIMLTFNGGAVGDEIRVDEMYCYLSAAESDPSKFNNTYIIPFTLRIHGNAYFLTQSENVTILGRGCELEIYDGAHFQSGDKDGDGATSEGTLIYFQGGTFYYHSSGALNLYDTHISGNTFNFNMTSNTGTPDLKDVTLSNMSTGFIFNCPNAIIDQLRVVDTYYAHRPNGVPWDTCTGFYVDGADYGWMTTVSGIVFTARDMVLKNIGHYDIYFYYATTNDNDWTMINSNIDLGKVRARGADNRVTNIKELKLRVVTETGDPIEGAAIIIDDVDGAEVVNTNTDITGAIDTQQLVESWVYSEGLYPALETQHISTPHTITISKAGYWTQDLVLDLTRDDLISGANLTVSLISKSEFIAVPVEVSVEAPEIVVQVGTPPAISVMVDSPDEIDVQVGNPNINVQVGHPEITVEVDR